MAKTPEPKAPTPPLDQQFCSNCLYNSRDKISCRRYPPVGTGVHGLSPQWPNVGQNDWCGEWKWNGK
jgi:hypothetical protein